MEKTICNISALFRLSKIIGRSLKLAGACQRQVEDEAETRTSARTSDVK